VNILTIKPLWENRSSINEINTATIAGAVGLRRDIEMLYQKIGARKYTGRVVTLVKVVKNENDLDLVAQDIEALQCINSIDERGEFSPVILDFIYVKVDSKRWPEFKDLQKYFKSKYNTEINPLNKRPDLIAR